MIQCFHQLSLKLSPGKCGKHSINLTTLIEFLNIQLLNRSQCIFGNAVHIGCDGFLDLVIQQRIVAALFAIRGLCRLNHSFKMIHLFDERTSHIFRKIVMSEIMADTAFLVAIHNMNVSEYEAKISGYSNRVLPRFDSQKKKDSSKKIHIQFESN